MPTKKTIPPLIELEVINSTNNYAMGLIHAGLAQHGQAVLAYQQTEGKGQRGKTWDSPAGESLSLSILLQPQFLQPAQGFQLLSTVAVAVQQVLDSITENTINIKWPNDLYWRDRKAGGILIESVMQGKQWNWAIVGIGINVNQVAFPGFLPNPVSLLQITGNPLEVKPLAITIIESVVNSLEDLRQNGFAHWFDCYNQQLYKRKEEVVLRQSNRRITTLVQGVTTEGQLITGHSGEQLFHFGEIEWML